MIPTRTSVWQSFLQLVAPGRSGAARRRSTPRTSRVAVETLQDRTLLAAALGDWERLGPQGSLIFQREYAGALSPVAPIPDETQVFLEGGQSLTVVATPDQPGSTLSISVFDADNNLLATRTASAAGETVDLQTVAIHEDGLYRVEVSGSVPVEFDLSLFRNAAVEVVDTANGAEQDANGSFVSLGSGRWGIVGTLEGDGDSVVQSGSIFVTHGDGTRLGTINKATAAGTDIGAFGAFQVYAAAFDTDGTLYTLIDGFGNATLATVNQSTGAVTTIGTGLGTAMISLEIMADGTMYGIGIFDEILYEIDKTTGTATAIGDTNIPFNMDLAVDSAGTLYATVGNNLFTVDRGTGAATFQGFISGVFEGEVMGIMFDHTDTLYATAYTPSSPLFTIDLTTLAATVVGNTSFFFAHGGDIHVTAGAPDSPATDVIVNGSFETGDFTGWTTSVNPDAPFIPWLVSGAGDGAGFGMASTDPQDGAFVAWNGFDGAGPLEFQMFQDVSLAGASTATLTWMDRVQWNFTIADGLAQARLYDVEIRDPSTNVILQTVFSFTTGPETLNPTGDTDWQTHTIDLSAFAGQTVRLMFRERIRETFTGPAQIEFDAIRLVVGETSTTEEDLYAAVGRGSPVNAGAVLTIDQATGAGTLLGNPSLPGGLTGLDFDSEGRLWASSINNQVSQLLEIDPETGLELSAVPITLFNLPISIGDLAIQPGTDAIFGVISNADAQPNIPGGLIVQIDRASGVATIVGNTFQNRGGGLAFTPEGTLYFLEFDELHRLNPADAAILGTTQLSFGSHDGLAVRPSDGALFATRSGAGALDDEIRRINPVTGVSTVVGHTGTGNASDLAFRVTAAPPSGPDVDEYLINLTAGAQIDIALSRSAGSQTVTSELIVNGGFETGTLANWTMGQGDFDADWNINNGSFDPEGPELAIAPIDGDFDATADQFGPSLTTLRQTFLVPTDLQSATLSWSDRIRSSDPVFDPGQEFRVLLLDGSGALISEVFSTDAGDSPNQVGPNARSFDVTDLLQGREGQNVQISFEVQATTFFFTATIDDVSLQVDAGETATSGPVTLELLDDNGNVLATGTPGAANFDRGILNFAVSETGVYTVRVIGQSGGYSIVVTEDLVFDTEPNDLASPLRSLNPQYGALGFLEGGTDFDTYEITLNPGDSIGFTTQTPFDSPLDGLNQLDPLIAVLDPDGNLAAFDLGSVDGKNAQVVVTPTIFGTYRVLVGAETAGAGEYLLTTFQVNDPPQVDLFLSSDVINENDTVFLFGFISDPEPGDSHQVTIRWSDGQPDTVIDLGPGETFFSASRQYLDDDPSDTDSDAYPIEVTVTDGAGALTTASTSVTVLNVQPVLVSATVTASIDENGVVTLSGTYADVGTLDTHELIVDWGEGGPESFLVSGGSFSVTHTYLDDNPSGTASDLYTITGFLTDDDGGQAALIGPALVDGPGFLVDVEDNSTIETAQSLDGLFNLDFNANIGDATTNTSTSIPHVTVIGTGDDTVDVFSFTVEAANTRAIFDVDFGMPDFDPWLNLRDSSGAVIFSADDAGTEFGQGGSEHPFDSYLEVVLTAPGVYYIEVGRFFNGAPVPLGADYELQVSLDLKAPLTVQVNNLDPVIESLSATSVDENGFVTLSGTYLDVGTQDTHEMLIDWGEGPAELVTVSGGVFSVTHQYLDDDPSGTPADVYTISVLLIDDDTGSDAASTTTTVSNVDPVITALANSSPECGDASENQPVTVEGLFIDVGTLDVHSAVIDWGDGETTSATVVQGAGSGSFSGSHSYAAGGIYTVTVTLADDDGGTQTATTTSVITGVGVVDGTLYVIGTDADDHVTINRAGSVYRVHADFLPSGAFRDVPVAGVTRIIVQVCGGDDHVTISSGVTLPALIDGGAGDDFLNGGNGPNIIIGGEGADKVNGGSGRDILIGGLGADQLRGNGGEDLLISGRTDFDEFDPDDHYQSLFLIMAEWNGSASLATRISRLKGEVSGGANGTTVLTALTVHDDSAQDKLEGGAGTDWFFANLDSGVLDKLTGLAGGEQTEDID